MTSQAAQSSAARNLTRLTMVIWAIAAVIAMMEAWAGRFSMGPDGISYLDMAEGFLHGGWHALVNGVWSPLYPLVLGVALRLAKPSVYWLFPLMHLVDFLAFLFAMACFEFFLRSLIASRREGSSREAPPQIMMMPEWALRVLGYLIFLWASLDLIGGRYVGPDTILEALVFLASGLLIRVCDGSGGWPLYIMFGATLALACTTKEVMFPVSFLFFGVAIISNRGRRRAVIRTLTSVVLFLLATSPLVIAISTKVGHVTFGEAGRLTYEWEVNVVSADSMLHPKGVTVKHPQHVLVPGLPVYEFERPIGGTYPPFYDRAYWDEGLELHFVLSNQLKAMRRSVETYYGGVFLPLSGFIAAVLVIFLMSPNRRAALSSIGRVWPISIPALGALALYFCVDSAGRYIAPFVVVLAVGVCSGLQLPGGAESKRLVMSAVIAVGVSLGTVILGLTLHRVQLWTSEGPQYWTAAELLTSMGVRPGDKIAVIGDGMWDALWARLAGVRIVAEVPSEEAARFWEAGEGAQTAVFNALAATGIRAVVADEAPPCALPGWVRLGNTNYHIRFLGTWPPVRTSRTDTPTSRRTAHIESCRSLFSGSKLEFNATHNEKPTFQAARFSPSG